MESESPYGSEENDEFEKVSMVDSIADQHQGTYIIIFI